MWEEIVKAIPVYFSSMIKFIFGPIGGYAAGLTLSHHRAHYRFGYDDGCVGLYIFRQLA